MLWRAQPIEIRPRGRTTSSTAASLYYPSRYVSKHLEGLPPWQERKASTEETERGLATSVAQLQQKLQSDAAANQEMQRSQANTLAKEMPRMAVPRPVTLPHEPVQAVVLCVAREWCCH